MARKKITNTTDEDQIPSRADYAVLSNDKKVLISCPNDLTGKGKNNEVLL